MSKNTTTAAPLQATQCKHACLEPVNYQTGAKAKNWHAADKNGIVIVFTAGMALYQHRINGSSVKSLSQEEKAPWHLWSDTICLLESVQNKEKHCVLGYSTQYLQKLEGHIYK